MKNTMRLTWRGHSCFKLEKDGYAILFDPYRDGSVPGYGPLREEADQVICSHEHRDHTASDLVQLRKADTPNPFTITFVECPHDDAGGSLRGMNRIAVLDDGAMRIVHFGDIGCMLTAEQLKAIGKPDLVMIPVGGFFTMEPEGILKLLDQLQPRIVIPMHYRNGALGYEKIGTLEAFASKRTDILHLNSNTFEFGPDTPACTAVFTYEG